MIVNRATAKRDKESGGKVYHSQLNIWRINTYNTYFENGGCHLIAFQLSCLSGPSYENLKSTFILQHQIIYDFSSVHSWRTLDR